MSSDRLPPLELFFLHQLRYEIGPLASTTVITSSAAGSNTPPAAPSWRKHLPDCAARNFHPLIRKLKLLLPIDANDAD